MHRATWLIIGSVFLAASAACTPSVNLEQERAALMTADREWSQTTKDPEKFVAYFAQGGSIYPPGMPIVTGEGSNTRITSCSPRASHGASRAESAACDA